MVTSPIVFHYFFLEETCRNFSLTCPRKVLDENTYICLFIYHLSSPASLSWTMPPNMTHFPHFTQPLGSCRFLWFLLIFSLEPSSMTSAFLFSEYWGMESRLASKSQKPQSQTEGGESCGQVNNFLTSSYPFLSFSFPLTKKGEEGFMKRLLESAHQFEYWARFAPWWVQHLRIPQRERHFQESCRYYYICKMELGIPRE